MKDIQVQHIHFKAFGQSTDKVVSVKALTLKAPTIKALTIVALLSSLAVSLSATQGFAKGLLESIQLAEKNDTAWHAEKLGIEAQRQQVAQIRAQLLPQISISAESFDTKSTIEATNRATTVSEISSIEQQATTYSANLSQTVYRGEQWYAWRAARILNQQLELQFAVAQQRFWLRVAGQYTDVLIAAAELAFRQAESAALARQLQQTEQRFELGIIAITDVHEARALADLATADLLLASDQLNVAQQVLTTSTADVSDSLKTVATDFRPPTSGESLAYWKDLAYNNNLDLELARLNQEFAQLEKRGQLMAFGPTLDLVASYTEGPTSPASVFDGDISTRAISLRFNLPLFQGGRQQAKYKESKLFFEQAQASLQNQTKLTTQATTTEFAKLRTDTLRINARSQSIVSANSALEATQAGYELGTRTIVDVLDAQKRVFSAKRNLTQAQLDYVLSYLNFQHTLGALSASTLGEIDAWLVKAVQLGPHL